MLTASSLDMLVFADNRWITEFHVCINLSINLHSTPCTISSQRCLLCNVVESFALSRLDEFGFKLPAWMETIHQPSHLDTLDGACLPTRHCPISGDVSCADGFSGRGGPEQCATTDRLLASLLSLLRDPLLSIGRSPASPWFGFFIHQTGRDSVVRMPAGPPGASLLNETCRTCH